MPPTIERIVHIDPPQEDGDTLIDMLGPLWLDAAIADSCLRAEVDLDPRLMPDAVDEPGRGIPLIHELDSGPSDRTSRGHDSRRLCA